MLGEDSNSYPAGAHHHHLNKYKTPVFRLGLFVTSEYRQPPVYDHSDNLPIQLRGMF